MIFNYKLDELKSKLDLEISNLKKENKVKTICMFDLTGSTSLKNLYGHEFGTKKALQTIFLSKYIVLEFGGQIIKELGDGILCVFDDPVNACLAGLAIKESSLKLNFKIRGGITLGKVEILYFEGRADVYGLAVDRCARISSFALPSQILIDKPLLEIAKSHLIDYRNIEISDGMKRILKGIGETELFEVSTSELGLKKYIYIPFRIHEEGRVPLSDKVFFVREAQKEVIEMGLGLTTFSKWFSGQRPSEFRDYIQNLLLKGVNFTLLAIDPEWEETKNYFKNIGAPDYVDDIRRSLGYLKEEQERLLKLDLRGEFKIYLYQIIPNMHILCVDPDDEINGRALISPYLFNIPRSECPVFEFSNMSNNLLFQKYIKTLKSQLKCKSKIFE